MKNQPGSKKNILIIAGIIVVAAVVFFYFSGDSTPEDGSLLATDNAPEANMISNRVLNLLNQIRSLKIDTTIFSTSVYQTFVDYSVTIPPVNVGRQNPFAPIPGAPGAAGAATTQ